MEELLVNGMRVAARNPAAALPVLLELLVIVLTVALLDKVWAAIGPYVLEIWNYLMGNLARDGSLTNSNLSHEWSPV